MVISDRDSGHGKQKCPCQCHWDLSWIRFGNPNISPGDVDGLFVVERKGSFLFLEAKREHEDLTLGQIITMESLSVVKGFTVIALFGDDNIPSAYMECASRVWSDKKPTSREDFQRRMDAWWNRANGF